MGRLRAILLAWPQTLAKPAAAAIVVLALVAAILGPRFSQPGLWEPHELSLADAALARIEREPKPAADPRAAACPRQAPPDALARTLPDRALTAALTAGASAPSAGAPQEIDEPLLRLPSLLLAILTLAASAGIAARLAGARAAALCALILLSFPLLTLQARQLPGELGTAAGAALSLYGLVSLRPIAASLVAALAKRTRAPSLRTAVLHLLDDVVSLGALALGLLLGFTSGGALLGVVVPLGAFACATGLGGGGLAVLGRLARTVGVSTLRAVAPRRAVGLRAPAWLGDRNASWLGVRSLVATIAAAAVLSLLVRDAIDLGALEPGTRQIFGKSLLPSSCYSRWLGGVWQGADDVRVLYDSSVEQIAFGTYPWGLLAPLAAGWLLWRRAPQRRLGGALALAWGGAAWIATEAFARKVGFTVYAGFPALAIAVALWLDAAIDDGAAPPGDVVTRAQKTPIFFALVLALGALTLGKDLQTFPERLTSLLVGDDAIKYPATARLWWLPLRAWILIGGMAVAVPAAWWMWRRQDDDEPTRHGALTLALLATALLSTFWIHGWHARLSELLSSKGVFSSYHAARSSESELVVYGNLGNAPRYYARGPYHATTSFDDVLAKLARPRSTFVVAPASELCALHRAAKAAGSPLLVLDNDNPRTILLSNELGKGRDKNPLLAALLVREPDKIAQRPESRIVFDDRIELLGWEVPAQVPSGAPFEVTLIYKILAPVGGTWRVFQHYDRPGARFSGDHVPIGGRCPTTDWRAGDVIVDRHTVVPTSAGLYDLWTGFFTGSAPSWQNMPLTLAPPQARDAEHRVKIATVSVR